MSTTRRTAAVILSTAAAACLIAGCVAKSGSSAANASSAAGAGASTAAGKAIAAVGGGGGVLDMSKQCAAIKPADVQALMKAPVTAVVNDPGECSFYGGDLKLDIYPNDPTQKYYQNPVGGPNTTALTGVGDQAQWFQPVQGATTPWVEAHKGSTTCVLSPADPPETTMTYTGNDPFFTITAADAATYAQEEGKLCSDVFTVG